MKESIFFLLFEVYVLYITLKMISVSNPHLKISGEGKSRKKFWLKTINICIHINLALSIKKSTFKVPVALKFLFRMIFPFVVSKSLKILFLSTKNLFTWKFKL